MNDALMIVPNDGTAIISLGRYEQLVALEREIDKLRSEIEGNAGRIQYRRTGMFNPYYPEYIGRDEALTLLSDKIENMEEKEREAINANRECVEQISNATFWTRFRYLFTRKLR